MTRVLVIIVILAVLLCGLAACASQLLDSGTRNTARTSCIGLINVGSCNITQSRDTNTGDKGLLLLGAFGVGCLALGMAWPSNPPK
jgi:hypothetical protein